MNDVKTQLTLMKSVVLGSLTECCSELLEWNETGLLRNGKVRKAASHLKDESLSCHRLIHVENFTKRLAMEFVVSMSNKT